MDSVQGDLKTYLRQLESGEDEIKANEGLTILHKLVTNIAQNPTEDKFRHLKLSNKTLAQKLYSMKLSYQILTSLGFIKLEDEYYLPDENLGLFIGSINEIRWAEMISSARLVSPQEVLSVQQIVNEQRIQQEKSVKEGNQKRQIEEQFKYDNQERKYIKVKDSVSKETKFGANVKRCEDIGIGKNKGG